MRVVTKGGFVQSERAVRLDVLRRYDALAVRGRLRGRAWWKPYNRRWTVSTLGWTHRAVVGLALVAGGVITSLILFR